MNQELLAFQNAMLGIGQVPCLLEHPIRVWILVTAGNLDAA